MYFIVFLSIRSCTKILCLWKENGLCIGITGQNANKSYAHLYGQSVALLLSYQRHKQYKHVRWVRDCTGVVCVSGRTTARLDGHSIWNLSGEIIYSNVYPIKSIQMIIWKGFSEVIFCIWITVYLGGIPFQNQSSSRGILFYSYHLFILNFTRKECWFLIIVWKHASTKFKRNKYLILISTAPNNKILKSQNIIFTFIIF